MSVSQRIRALREHLGINRTMPQTNGAHLQAAVDWLRRAQDATPDDGVAQTYFVKTRRWAKSYPETTGYIIPTLYRYAEVYGDPDARARARRMAHWECDIQLPDGGVVAGALGDSDQPTIFNTGQVLFGWARAFEMESDERLRDAAVRAADWLCKVQDPDGCWRRFGSPMTSRHVNTYNTRTAWALARTYEVSGNSRYLDCAVRNCDWAMTQRNRQGWLAQNCLLDDRQPYVHTIAYAMRGLLEVGVVARRTDFIDAACQIGAALLKRLPANGALPGRFDADWQTTVRYACLTGNAQLAVNWGRVFLLRGGDDFRAGVHRIVEFLKTTQPLTGDSNERGGLKGSHPIDGGYHPWQFPNWATKYLVDALMMDDLLQEPATPKAPGFFG
jgi:hypothetical protein